METPAETVLPVYVVGDSHALPYRNLVFREKWAGHWVMARAKYIPSLNTHLLFNADTGEFHPELIAFLEFEGLVRNGQATHLSREAVVFDIAKAAGQPVRPPLLLIAVGDIDIRGAIMPLLKDTHDFVPPFETNLPLLEKQLLPWDVIEEAIDARLGPLIVGLKELTACGFNRLYVQSVVPPTRNEARVKELHQYNCPVSVRTKLVVAFNRKLTEQCESIGVTVLDNWPKLTEGGLLRPDLDFDGVHLPPLAARWFLEALLLHTAANRALLANHVRYELYYRMACGLDPFRTEVAAPDAS